MISVKYAIIIAVAAFAAGSFFASPMPQAIAAVIATDVQCTGCVGTPDLAGNAVTAVKIKDSEVKAAEIATGAVGASEIATDAVGGSELQGVTKLLFGQCAVGSTKGSTSVPSGNHIEITCTISGVDSDDSAVATLNLGHFCFEVAQAITQSGNVLVELKNDCDFTTNVGSDGKIGVIVFDK